MNKCKCLLFYLILYSQVYSIAHGFTARRNIAVQMESKKIASVDIKNSPLYFEGEGDCDDTSECQDGLFCINERTGEIESYLDKVEGTETCEYRQRLFSEGFGDCDDSSECRDGLLCINERTGEIESYLDKIEGAETCEYNQKLFYEGFGDCDDSSECQDGLFCINERTGEIESYLDKIEGAETCERQDESGVSVIGNQK